MVEEQTNFEGNIYPLSVGYLPEYFQRKAETELCDTPINRKEGLKLFREMLANSENLKGMTFDEDFLLQYLKCTKFEVNSAFRKLQCLINLRQKMPAMFTDLKFDVTSFSMKHRIATFLPYRCHEGSAIILIEFDNWIPEEFSLDEMKRMIVIYLLQSLKDPMTQINGFKIILDITSNPLKHLRYMTPTNLHLLLHGTQECTPGRFKSIHIVNDSVTFRAAWFLMKYFISEKLKTRMHFHSEPDELVNFFPRQVLPEKYGGDLQDIDMTGWLKDVMHPDKLAKLVGTTDL